MTTTKKPGRPRGTLGPAAMSDYVDTPSGGKKVDRIAKAINTYEKRARTPASKEVQNLIAGAVASTLPLIKTASKVAPKSHALVKQIGLDKYISHLAKAYSMFSSPSTKAKARAIIGKKPLTKSKTGASNGRRRYLESIGKTPTESKTSVPMREVTSPVQRSPEVKARAAREAARKKSREAQKTRKTPKTFEELRKDVGTRFPKQGKLLKDKSKVPMTSEMKKEASRFRASRRKVKKGVPSALKKIGAGITMGAGTKAALSEMDKWGAKKSRGGQVKRGAALRGFRKERNKVI